jgi:hypothetical protein
MIFSISSKVLITVTAVQRNSMGWSRSTFSDLLLGKSQLPAFMKTSKKANNTSMTTAYLQKEIHLNLSGASSYTEFKVQGRIRFSWKLEWNWKTYYSIFGYMTSIDT